MPFSGTTFGVQAASKYFFNVDAKDLNIPQAALLAGVVNGPTVYSPVTTRTRHRPPQPRARRHAGQGQDHAGRARRRRRHRLDLNVTPVPSNCVGAVQAPYFCDYVDAPDPRTTSGLRRRTRRPARSCCTAAA